VRGRSREKKGKIIDNPVTGDSGNTGGSVDQAAGYNNLGPPCGVPTLQE